MDITTIFFDFDGVVADTEPLYDIFWRQVAEKYHIGIPDFPAKIKELGKITRACDEYEETMDFPEVKGAVRFLHMLKTKGYRVGLVTSSYRIKIERALKLMDIEKVFDTIVTADRITSGKPDPMCYLLAARDLQVDPGECVVFEDSFSGIQAGTVAGMRVIGLATTNPEEAIGDKVSAVIPDFSRPEKVLELLS